MEEENLLSSRNDIYIETLRGIERCRRWDLKLARAPSPIEFDALYGVMEGARSLAVLGHYGGAELVPMSG